MGVPFADFLAPGLIVMGMIQNAFANSSFSLLAGKIQGTIIDLLMPPLSSAELMIGIVGAAVTRALMVGGALALAMWLWPGVSLPIAHPWAIAWFGLMGALFLSFMGLVTSLWGEKFDHNAAITNFIVAPLSLLLLACLYLLGRNLYESRNVRFSAEEMGMLDSLVAGLSKTQARHLIDQGMWLSGKEGDVLTREGEPVNHLYYLAEGEARVMSSGAKVGICRAGDLVGELTVLSGEVASATVILNGPARFWCAPAEDLRPYVEAHEDIRRAIEHGFAAALKAKLRASNRTIAEAGRAAPPG